MQHASTRARYNAKQTWQFFHQQICGRVGKLCGHTLSYYRNRDDGMWHRATIVENMTPAKAWKVLPVNADEVARAKAFGPAFIAKLGVPAECVVLTYVPTTRNDIASANAIAAALGLKLVSPIVSGLETFDGSHLDPASAERFSNAFLQEAEPRLEACLGHHT